MVEVNNLSRSKREGIVKSVLLAASVFFLLIPANLFGEMETPRIVDETTGFSASLSSSYQFKSNLDGGGDVSVSWVGLALGRSVPLNTKTGLGLSLTYNREIYNFANPSGFSVSNPWNQVNRLGLGMRLRYKLYDNWSLAGGTVIQYAGEEGASFGDSLMYGGNVRAVYRVNPNLMIGFGAGVFNMIQETRVFPSLYLSWKINDRLRLGNSSHLGPAGPAGLELSYRIDKDWDMAIGAGRRYSRFRLDKNGATPGGIGENSSWPVFARIGWKFRPEFTLDFYGGMAFNGKLTLQDSGGNDINSVSYNTAPILGFNLLAAF